ncbi:MAG: helix-turn-helix domain-containing protein [Devosia sp.]
MSIIRRRHQGAFATIPNSVANDEVLSFAERGLLVYLLAKPEGWSIQIADLQKQGGVGRDLAYKLLNALIARGYVRREKMLDPDTRRVIGVNYDVFDAIEPLPEIQEVGFGAEKPGIAPLPEKPEVDGGPLPDLPDTANQDAYKRQTLTKTDSISSASANDEDPTAALCEVLDKEHAEALIAHFNGLGKPLTGYTAKLKAEQLDKFPDPNRAAEELISNGWRSLKRDWAPHLTKPQPSQRAGNEQPADMPLVCELDGDRDHQLIVQCEQFLGHFDYRPQPGIRRYTRKIVDRARTIQAAAIGGLRNA